MRKIRLSAKSGYGYSSYSSDPLPVAYACVTRRKYLDLHFASSEKALSEYFRLRLPVEGLHSHIRKAQRTCVICEREKEKASPRLSRYANRMGFDITD